VDRTTSPTVVHVLRQMAQLHGDVDAYVEAEGERLSFGEWDRAAEGMAAAFSELGVTAGDVVALSLPSSADYAVCYQAAMRLGAITSGMNPRLGRGEIASIIGQTEPRLLVVEDDRNVVTSGSILLRRSELADMRAAEARTRVDSDPASPVAVVWTSGTTGSPKGVVFDHENLVAVDEGAGAMGAPFDRRISSTPFSHVAYMTHLWEEISNVMTTVISPTPWKASEALRLMDLEQVTVGQGVPSQWRLMLDHPNFPSTDLSHLRIAGTGAAPVPPDLVREMRHRLGCPVVIGYASTEAAIISGSDPEDSADVIARTVGRPRSNVEVQIVGASGSLRSGEVGMVRCRSAAVMRKYWRNPEATADAIDGDGWLSTGDLGSIDSEGYVVLAGRKTDMYFRGAYNVYPMEVERILSEHGAVDQVAVVAKSDPVLGDVGVAFVVPAPGEQPTLEELRGWCKQSLADYKAPDMLALVPELPLTPIGKVDKAALSEVASSLKRSR
jgi:acyl-CoA synthetase (AMP-forming)/AMP-acid ligase II